MIILIYIFLLLLCICIICLHCFKQEKYSDQHKSSNGYWNGIHTCKNEWAIEPGKYHHAEIIDIHALLASRKPKKVKFKEIAAKTYTDKRTNTRYKNANTKFPGIICPTINPYGKKYRMVDGSHRLLKMMDEGKNESLFYIITEDEFFSLLKQN